MAGRAFAAVVVLVLLPAFFLPLAGASADSISGVEANIQAIEAKVTAQATTIHQLTSSYQQATLQASTLSQQITVDRASLGGLQAAVSSSRSDLREAAIRAYTNGASPSAATTAARTNPGVGDEYLAVASGDVNDTVDRLGLQQRRLRSAELNLAQEQQANRAAVAAAAKARDQALAAAGQEQVQLDSLQTHLQQLQTAAAQAAATAAANSQAAAAAQAAKAAADEANANQGAPVNGGLVDVVRSEVSDAPVPAAPVSASTPDPSIAATPVTAGPATADRAPTTPATTGIATSTSDPTTSVQTTPPTTAAPAQAAAPPASPVGGSIAADLAQLRQCESGGNYGENTGNGFYGAYQFSASTWSGLGYPGRPDQEPASMQDQAAAQLEAANGWGQWPACSATLGL